MIRCSTSAFKPYSNFVRGIPKIKLPGTQFAR
jgi:hypothetical protein